ncbi:hypothetical protein ZIOFF_051222 [Zingiber officinale]|uniref:Uncharacterized protein n=1 Tax=Zingiber officinale TaxID=94328 RepID=A0A8J5FT10_ZINOF|nr:hypothetical protein ZIOFF_051222 [Zingiber officinale]
MILYAVDKFAKQLQMADKENVSHGHIEGGDETTRDPAKLRAMVENIDAKIDALKAKRERIIRQLYELEGAGA